MAIRRLTGHLRTLALTAFVSTAVLASGIRPAAAAQAPAPDRPPSLEHAEGSFDEKPLEAEMVTASALLTVLKVPEKVRLRFGLKDGCTHATPVEAASRPLTGRARHLHPTQDALPAIRLAERAGRCSAPSTAPPLPTA